MQPAPSNLLASLVDKSFKYDSARGTDSGRDELFSELVLCASGQGRLRRTVRSTTFFGGDGFLGSGQTVKTYFGSWTLQASSTSAEVSLLVTQVGARADPSEVSSTLSQLVRVEAGAAFFDDRSSFGVRSDRNSAAVSDAAALCNGVPPAPSPPAPGPAPVPPPTNMCAGVDESMSSCVACAAAACCSELQACLPGTPCSALFECVAACDSEAACIDTSCASLFGAAGEVQALNQCLATACLDPCQ